MIADRKTLSIAKACELVGVSRRTIYNWIAGGKVEYVRTAGGSVRIFVDTLWRRNSSSRRAVSRRTSICTGASSRAAMRWRHSSAVSPSRIEANAAARSDR